MTALVILAMWTSKDGAIVTRVLDIVKSGTSGTGEATADKVELASRVVNVVKVTPQIRL